MKQIYLLTTIVLFSASLFAQSGLMTAKEVAKISAPAKVLTGREVSIQEIPMTPTILQEATSDHYVGTTYYKTQSNAAVSQRIVVHEDGTVGFTWIASPPGGTTYPNRGSGYNYHTGNRYYNSYSTTSRIETERTGWPTMGALTDGENTGEIIIAHDGANGLIVSTRTTKGEGDWAQKLFRGPSVPGPSGPPSTALLWPSIATYGTTIHLIACTNSDEGYLYEGINTCLLYYKGEYDFETNDITWTNPRIVGNVRSNYIKQFSGDSYGITVNGDKVAILVCSSWLDNFYWLSEDGGDTWGERELIYETAVPAQFTIWHTAVVDTPYVCDGNGSIAIDDDGVVHVALGICRVLNEDNGEGGYSYFPGTGGLLYWNSEMGGAIPSDLADERRNNMDPYILEEADYTIIWMPPLDYSDTAWFANGIDFPTGYGCGLTSMPQLITDGDNVYIVYSSVLQYPLVDEGAGLYFRGIFATKSTDKGETWPDEATDGVSWLSYGEGVFLVDWEDYDETYNSIPLLFFRSENIEPALAANIVDGKLNVMWSKSFIPGEEDNIETNMYWLSIDANKIGDYNNTRRVWQGEADTIPDINITEPPIHSGITENSIKNSRIYPNPANNHVSLEFISTNANTATVTITNIMGQTVMTQVEKAQKGHNKLNFNVSHLSNGFYLVNVNTPTGKITQKLIIQ